MNDETKCLKTIGSARFVKRSAKHRLIKFVRRETKPKLLFRQSETESQLKQLNLNRRDEFDETAKETGICETRRARGKACNRVK